MDYQKASDAVPQNVGKEWEFKAGIRRIEKYLSKTKQKTKVRSAFIN